MLNDPVKSSKRVLDPIDRVSEVLFGLIMVLTFTGSLSVAEAGREDIRAMLIGALGCNLAWGVIDAVLYLMGSLNERGRNHRALQSVQQGDDLDVARRTIADALPAPIAAVTSHEELEAMRRKLLALPGAPRPYIAKDEWLGALGVCLLVFLSTFPVVIPFLFIGDVRPALLTSNVVAVVLLFLCGHVFARHSGLRPWPAGLVMVAIGVAMVGVAIALGG